MIYTQKGLDELNRWIIFLSKNWLRYRRFPILGSYIRKKLLETNLKRDIYFKKLREQIRKTNPERFIQ